MATTVVLGSQFGDEGKGKLVDVLLSSGQFRLVARCAGGHNAGHTLVVNGVSFDFHILPSGLVAPGAINIIGNGCVFHVPQFFKELSTLQQKGIDSKDRIFVSDRAHVLFELHKRVDGLREKALGAAKVGTTGNGIGPCYSDKASRGGLRVAEIFEKSSFDLRLRALAQRYRNEFGDSFDYDVEVEIANFDKWREDLRDFVIDSTDLVCNVQDAEQQILVEAANALLLDIDGGTYPFVTSSSTGLAGVFSGLLGIRPESVVNRIGVVKAYTTRVGSGPFPTEDFGEVGNTLQEVGREIGTTTGRRRRCGWLDLVLLRYSNAINRYTVLNITKLDILNTFATLKVATAYTVTTRDGATIRYEKTIPADWTLLDVENGTCKVEYEELPGWQSDISKVTSWRDLPEQAKQYVLYVEKMVGVYVRWIGVGPGREAMIDRGLA